ncbi:PRC-barrel domain-containing protein [Halomonas sp. SH5A2]|uniref:PRC-barrel domain-containing protein n=1 Tax=Halomonas sp. SH5A2 TaxID=2749040 RepID=UPI0016400C6A|nr:PRC-barrel domain-containing protein [Halomonas sp. SH5A2]QNI02781.1 PRC-barrel domain-containing protein [Halomonas sp. SH5A2]
MKIANQSNRIDKENRMKRTALAIAVGALSFGLTQSLLAQDEKPQANEQQQTNSEGVQQNEHDQEAQGAEVRVEGEPADVDVEQEPAEIQVEQQSPDVTVEQQPPEVTIEQPDPNVTVEQAEPNVTVEDQGEANIEVESAENVDAEMRDPNNQEQDASQQNKDEASEDQAEERNAFIDRNVSEIQGYAVYRQEDGEEVGDIERVVRDTQSGDIYVVITEGGFLGFGEDEMGYKVDDLELRNDNELVVRSSNSAQTGDYSSDQYEDIDSNQTLREAMQSN